MSAAPPVPASRYVAAARHGRAAEALEARHGVRLDRPALRKDLVIRRQVQVGEVRWVVKQPVADKFYTFDDGEWTLIELFDGTRTRSEILEEYLHRFPGAAIGLNFVVDYEEMLRKIDLVEQTAVEQNLQLLSKFKNLRQRAAEEKAEGFNVLFMLFKVFDPDRILTRTLRYVRWLWRPPVVAFFCLTFVFTIAVFATRFDTIWAQTIELYSFLKKPFWDFVQFWVIMTGIGAIHEFGHGYTVKMYGGEVHDMGIALLYFAPGLLLRHDGLAPVHEQVAEADRHGGRDLHRGDSLHDRDGALGGELSRHAPSRAGLQDDALHGSLDGLLQHQPSASRSTATTLSAASSRSRSCARSRSAGSAPSSSAMSCA